MHKPRQSKYFVFRCECVIHDLTRKYAYATWVHLDDRPDLDIKSGDEQEVKMPISLFCDDNAISKERIKRGFFFYVYMKEKGTKKTLLIEPRKFPPVTAKMRAAIERKAKDYEKLFCEVE